MTDVHPVASKRKTTAGTSAWKYIGRLMAPFIQCAASLIFAVNHAREGPGCPSGQAANPRGRQAVNVDNNDMQA